MKKHIEDLNTESSENLKILCNHGLSHMQSTWSKEDYTTFLECQTRFIASTKAFTSLYYITELIEQTKPFAEFEDKIIYLALPKQNNTAIINSPHGEITPIPNSPLYTYVFDLANAHDTVALLEKLITSPLNRDLDLPLAQWFKYQEEFLPLLKLDTHNLKKIFATFVYNPAFNYFYRTTSTLLQAQEQVLSLRTKTMDLLKKYDLMMSLESKIMMIYFLNFSACVFDSRIKPIVLIMSQMDASSENGTRTLIDKIIKEKIIASKVPNTSIQEKEEILYQALYQSFKKVTRNENRELPENLWEKS